MRDDRDFENIIDAMGGTPPAMMPPPPPPTKKERLVLITKTLIASLILFFIQISIIGFAIMTIHATIVAEFGFSVSGIGYWPSTWIATLTILAITILRKASS